jgi:hypothetical protein
MSVDANLLDANPVGRQPWTRLRLWRILTP